MGIVIVKDKNGQRKTYIGGRCGHRDEDDNIKDVLISGCETARNGYQFIKKNKNAKTGRVNMMEIQSIGIWVAMGLAIMLLIWRRTYCKRTRLELEKLMYRKEQIRKEMVPQPEGAIATPGTRWAFVEEDRKKALEAEMVLVIANIDRCRFWLKLLLANPGDLKPLMSFDEVEKRQRTSSNTKHQKQSN